MSEVLHVNDFGAGSTQNSDIQKKISEIAANAVSDSKIRQTVISPVQIFTRPEHIIEMGSSLGISTAYLASADSSSRVITIEGSPAIAAIAKETFQKLELKNIQLDNRKI